jgi:vacuolar-type H+-ATPase subunit H
MPDVFSDSVEHIEIEAEKIIQQAKTKAADILMKAKEKAIKISSSDLTADDVKQECEKIINEANREGDIKIGNAKKSAGQLKQNATRNSDKIAKYTASIVAGTE